METAVESITPLVTPAGVTLDLQLPAEPIFIDGDGARLAQVFANVLHNAVKFTPREGRIWFTAERRSDVAIVRIRDTGVGIAPDDVPRVFDRFFRVDRSRSRKDSPEGIGLGLCICKAVVEAHGGTISCTSAVGRGTEFLVELRLADEGVVSAARGLETSPVVD